MNNAGIDYGLGKTNIDKSTGIRYGVISLNSLDSWVYEDLVPEYGCPTCPCCGDEVRDGTSHDYYCDECEQGYNTEECFSDSPLYHILKDNNYEAHTDYDGINLFVLESKYYTLVKYCSPCVPGAGDLNSPCIDGVKAYCLGHEQFEDGKAPYPIYEVATGKLVEAP